MSKVLALLPYGFVIAIQAIFHALDRLPPHWDPARHTELALGFANVALENGPVAMLARTVESYAYYPPGFHATTAVGLMIFGRDVDVAQILQTIYLLATMAAVQAIVRRHASLPWATLAAFVYGGLPVVLGLSRLAYIENLMALQIAGLLWLFDRRDFWWRRWTIVAAGLLLGYGQVTKWNFVLLALPLVVIVAVNGLRGGEEGRVGWRRATVALLVMGLLAIAIAGPWTFQHFDAILRDVKHHGIEATSNFPPIHSPSSIAFYLHAFPMQMVWIPVSAIFAAGLVAALVRGGRTRSWAFAVLGALLLFSLAPHKQGRFVMPLMPIIVAGVVLELARSHVRLRRPVVVLWLLLTVVNVTTQTFDLRPWLPRTRVQLPFRHHAWWISVGARAWRLTPITTTTYPIERFVRAARADAGDRPLQMGWKLDEDHPAVNRHTIAAYAEAEGMLPQWREERCDYWIWRGDASVSVDDIDGLDGFVVREIESVTLDDGTALRLLRRDSR